MSIFLTTFSEWRRPIGLFSRINKRQINVNCPCHDMTHHEVTTIFNLGNKQISSVCLSFDSSNLGQNKLKDTEKQNSSAKHFYGLEHRQLDIYVGFSQNFSVEKLNCSSQIYISSLHKCTNLCFSPFVQKWKSSKFSLNPCFIIFYLKFLGPKLKYILVKLSQNGTLRTCNDNLMSF